MSTSKKAALLVFIVGVVLAILSSYLVPKRVISSKFVKKVETLISQGYSEDELKAMMKEVFNEEDGLLYVIMEDFSGKTTISVSRPQSEEVNILEIKRSVEKGVLRLGFDESLFYRKGIGYSILISGFILTLIIALSVYFYFEGVTTRLSLISSYLKESDLEDVEALVKEEWPSEIKKVVTAIELLMKKVERTLKVKIEEAKRDKLFAHNSMVELVDCLDRVSQGDLKVRAETTPDMVGALGEAFNDALRELEERIGEAQELVRQLEGRVQGEAADIEQIKGYLEKLRRVLGYFKTLDTA